jgi:hypothetical protein
MPKGTVHERTDTAYFTVHSAPDAAGRQRFTVEWWMAAHALDGASWRRQDFHASLDDWKSVYRMDGRRVEIIEAVGS